MRTGVVLVLAGVLGVVLATAAFASDQGRSRPPATLKTQEKVIWMGEWAACRHQSLNGLARESEVAAQRTFWRTRLEERVEQLGPPQSVDDRELEELARVLEDEAPHSNPHTATELAQLREAVDKLPEVTCTQN